MINKIFRNVDSHNQPKEIHSILKKSSLLFCAGGGTIYDGIANKCIIFYSPINDHQIKNISMFQKIKCGFLINNFKANYLKLYINKILNNKSLINLQLKKYRKIIQKNGVIEVKKILCNFLDKDLIMIILETIIIFFLYFQSIFGIGLLVFGTPTLMILGYQYSDILSVLLPISCSISLIQIINAQSMM